MSLVRDGVMLLGFLFVATVLGGFFGAVGDIAAPSLIAGTPLAPQSGASPIAWTVVAGAVIYGFSEVRD